MRKQESRSSAPILGASTRNFVVVGFYTTGTPYEEEIKDLVASCKQFGIHCHTQGYPNRGEWVRNAAIKPEFLLHMMDLHPFQKIVYLDADARIRQYPKLFDEMDADIAVHYRNGSELLSGTIFLTPNDRTKGLVQAWMEEQRRRPRVWDQHVLAEVLKKWPDQLKKAELPATYCQIFDTMKKAGQPVIEHLQASRRFKNLVRVGMSKIPDVIHGVRVRQSSGDGSYWIPKDNKKVEDYLDKHCIRLPGKKRWIPRHNSDNKIEDFRDKFAGETCYIVGKGPSLDHLRWEHFLDPDAPIIALNEAIYAVEKLGLPNPTFGLQQDATLRASCLPERSPIFVSEKALHFYAIYEKAYVFSNAELKLNTSALSVSAAIAIAKKLGVQGFELVCFDACVSGNTDYAKCVGYKPTWGGRPERFLTHRQRILRHAQDVPIKWTIPEAPVGATADKSQQSPDNRKEHRAPAHGAHPNA